MKTVLVTGSSRGMGATHAMLFAKNGYNVIINYSSKSSEEKAKAIAEQINNDPACGSAIFVQADVSNEAEVEAMVKQGLDAFGSIDVLINNAGIAGPGEILTYTSEMWDKVFAINVKGMFLCARAVLPNMIKNGGGSIVNISSGFGKTGAAEWVAYSSTKAAVLGFTKALAKEVGPSGIRVNAIAPGVIKTEINADTPPEVMKEFEDAVPLKRTGEKEEIAETALFLASDKSSFITGQVLSVDGGLVI